MNATPQGWPVSWMFWHPHQRLWNGGLVGVIERAIPVAAINRPIRGLIMLIDSGLLFVRAVARRVSLVGLRRIFSKPRVRDGVRVLYVDVGTHKDGAELALMTDTI